MSYPLRYVDEGLVVNDGAWAWFRLPVHGYDALGETQLLAHLAQGERLIGGLREAVGHLLVVPRPFSLDAWAAQLDARARRPAPGWEGYLATVREHLRGQAFRSREVYLGLRLPPGLVGRHSGRPTDEEAANLQAAARQMHERVEAGCPGARLAADAELRWLIRRSLWREIDEGEWRGPTGDYEAPDLLDGVVARGHRHVGLGGEETGERPWWRRAFPWLGAAPVPEATVRSWMATLAVAHMPDGFTFPGGSEWLLHMDRLGYPVEASVRFVVVPPRQAARDVDGKVGVAWDQMAHIGEIDAPVPLDVQDAYAGARELEHALRRGQYPLVYAWPRLIVAGATRPLMEERSRRLTEAYRDLGLELVRPSGDQMALLRESIPGDRIRIDTYRQTMPPKTLAGSMWSATATVGRREDPYLGWTTGTTRAFVGFDPLRAATDRAGTVTVLTGEPGSGKTNALGKLAHEARLRGADVVLLGRKAEDVEGLCGMAGLGETQMVRLDDRYEGLLDPFRIEPAREDAQLLAAELCRAFLPVDIGRASEANLLAAAMAEAAAERNPTLGGIVTRLSLSPSPIAQDAAGALWALATKPLARLCFGRGGGQRLVLEDRLTVLLLDNLGLPAPGTRPDDWAISERLAVGLLRAITALVGQMLAAADRHRAKLLGLDEAWALLSSSEGRRLVERIARIGRARNVALVLATQSRRDFDNDVLQECIGTRLEFRNSDNAVTRAFRSGECLMTDTQGNVGRVQVDLVTKELAAALDTNPKPEEVVA